MIIYSAPPPPPLNDTNDDVSIQIKKLERYFVGAYQLAGDYCSGAEQKMYRFERKKFTLSSTVVNI